MAMQYWLNIYLNRINDAYTRIFEILDIAPVEKKKSVIGAYLEEQGYIEETEEKPEDHCIKMIDQMVLYSVNHLNNSYIDAISADYLEMLDIIAYDMQLRKEAKENGG